jgi:signal transduction histidine kinase
VETDLRRPSIGFPLALAITLSVVALALAVGWQLLVVGELRPLGGGLTPLHWVLIILGSVFFVLIIVGLVLLCVWLVREIRFNQRQQAFLDAVTHEMKTPLAALRLYLETLDRRDPTPERRRAFLRRMGEDVERLERTVNQVLTAARSETAAPRGPAEAIDLTALLRECAGEIRERHALPEQAIRVERREPLRAMGRREELAVVFRNLLENAVKYSDPPAEVRIFLRETADGRPRVEISDRGIGIDRRELRKIFQRFYRVGRDVQRQAAGLGLGLFIVGSLVRRNGGHVKARSEGSGRGSRFLVTLRPAPTSASAVPLALPADAGHRAREGA